MFTYVIEEWDSILNEWFYMTSRTQRDIAVGLAQEIEYVWGYPVRIIKVGEY